MINNKIDKITSDTDKECTINNNNNDYENLLLNYNPHFIKSSLDNATNKDINTNSTKLKIRHAKNNYTLITTNTIAKSKNLLSLVLEQSVSQRYCKILNSDIIVNKNEIERTYFNDNMLYIDFNNHCECLSNAININLTDKKEKFEFYIFIVKLIIEDLVFFNDLILITKDSAKIQNNIFLNNNEYKEYLYPNTITSFSKSNCILNNNNYSCKLEFLNEFKKLFLIIDSLDSFPSNYHDKILKYISNLLDIINFVMSNINDNDIAILYYNDEMLNIIIIICNLVKKLEYNNNSLYIYSQLMNYFFNIMLVPKIFCHIIKPSENQNPSNLLVNIFNDVVVNCVYNIYLIEDTSLINKLIKNLNIFFLNFDYMLNLEKNNLIFNCNNIEVFNKYFIELKFYRFFLISTYNINEYNYGTILINTILSLIFKYSYSRSNYYDFLYFVYSTNSKVDINKSLSLIMKDSFISNFDYKKKNNNKIFSSILLILSNISNCSDVMTSVGEMPRLLSFIINIYNLDSRYEDINFEQMMEYNDYLNVSNIINNVLLSNNEFAYNILLKYSIIETHLKKIYKYLNNYEIIVFFTLITSNEFTLFYCNYSKTENILSFLKLIFSLCYTQINELNLYSKYMTFLENYNLLLDKYSEKDIDIKEYLLCIKKLLSENSKENYFNSLSFINNYVKYLKDKINITNLKLYN